MGEKFHLLKNSVVQMTKAKQYVLFFGVSTLVLLSLSGLLGMKVFGTSISREEKPSNAKPKEKRIKIESSGTNLNQQEIWVDRLEKDRDFMKKRLEELEKLVVSLTGQKLSVSQAAFEVGAQETPSSSSNGAQNTLNSSFLETKTNEGGLKEEKGQGEAVSSVDLSKQASDPSFVRQGRGEEKPKFQRISFQLDPQLSKKIKRSIDHYVPAGSFVRGILTSGVVASTSVQASSNPQPVHIQLTDLGNLPRGFKTDIKHCFLIGSAYGDLPSERVFMRLEKLSCVERKTQEVIDLSIDGYVAGEDGANGLRGILVDRSGPAMRNAFVGGFFAGMGNFFGQQKVQVPTTISQGGVAAINPLTAQNMLEAGAGKGVGNAMEKFSDFYIKRAEQLQPVIEIEPGRKVDVVFKGGFDMNQTVYRQSVMNTHDAERRDAAARADEQNLQTMKGLTQ